MTAETVALGLMRGTVKDQQTITASTVGEALAGGTTQGVKGLTGIVTAILPKSVGGILNKITDKRIKLIKNKKKQFISLDEYIISY